jgi:hypothetical protein
MGQTCGHPALFPSSSSSSRGRRGGISTAGGRETALLNVLLRPTPQKELEALLVKQNNAMVAALAAAGSSANWGSPLRVKGTVQYWFVRDIVNRLPQSDLNNYSVSALLLVKR